MRARRHRRPTGRRDCQLARRDQGQVEGGSSEDRRHHLHGERRKGGVLHRECRSRTVAAALPAGCLRIHGWDGGRALWYYSRGRAFRRSDGDGDGSEACAHGQSRVRGRLRRDGGAGIRPRLHRLLADGPDGRDGRRVGDSGGLRRRRRQAGKRRGGRRHARRLRTPARRNLCGRARLCRCASHTRGNTRYARVSARGVQRIHRPAPRGLCTAESLVLKPFVTGFLLLAAACATTKAVAPQATPGTSAPVPPPPVATPSDASHTAQPAVEPPVAYMLGLMPLKSTGVDVFRAAHPTYDGRGVLIAILDSGIDPNVPGLIATSTGAPKVIELRDFSAEGRVALTPFAAPTESALRGAARIARLTTATTWYHGVFRELSLGHAPAADVNGNGRNTDEFPVVVVKASDGWVAFIDTNLDGSFEDEMPLHDYRQGRETIALGTKPLTIVANFSGSDSVPVLDLFFDTSGHGTHVAGIAVGYNLYNVSGFTGVAPGAQVIGLKIANNARGGVTVHGSMMRAMDYAARYAAQRNLPLVLNLSFGVGNEHEGKAVIDSIVDAFLLSHPAAVFSISAGNDGPGLSTLGFPGSADLALSVGASYPGVFTQPPQQGAPPPRDVMGWFSSRGGELAKPDILAPGVAFSTVPPWDTGNEIKGGTSMSAPHASGLAACLISALVQEGRRPSAAEIVPAGARTTEIRLTYRRSSLGAPGVYVGTVTAWNPHDTLAGPLFKLINTVIVPIDLESKVFVDERRVVGPAAVQRYFLRVTQPGATLRTTVTLPDSQGQQAAARLYEPNGQPARAAPEDVDLGREQRGTATIVVRAEDLIPGVYELDVVAPPLASATATVRAELGPVALSPTQHGLEASNLGSTVTAEFTHRLVGVERTYAISGRGQPAETLTVRPPSWAKRMEVDIDLPPDLWDEFTDFAVTAYDRSEEHTSELQSQSNLVC